MTQLSTQLQPKTFSWGLDSRRNFKQDGRMVAISPLPARVIPGAEDPDIADLVIEDDTPVDNILFEKNARLLTESLYTSWSGPPVGPGGKSRPFRAHANVGLFHTKGQKPIVPDVMLSLDVEGPTDLDLKEDRSYFVWRVGKVPDVVIELVSNTEGDELGDKLNDYARIGIPDYVVYDPLHKLSHLELRTFSLRNGLYVEIARPWFPALGLGLVIWDGIFEKYDGEWLRWCTLDGQVVPTGAEHALAESRRADTAEHRADTAEHHAHTEKLRADTAERRADTEKLRADTEKLRADAEKARAESLAAKLRRMGMDLDADK